MHSRQSDETDGAREERRRDRDRLRVKKKKMLPKLAKEYFSKHFWNRPSELLPLIKDFLIQDSKSPKQKASVCACKNLHPSF